jgi:hypothetical protein
LGRQLERVGLSPVRLEMEGLLAASRRNTGLDDFGDAAFRDGLGRLLRSLEEEAALSSLGRFIARTDVLQGLERRLRLLDWHTRHPEIGAGVIRRPIVIVGQGRTGTTILHELLALDPANRIPQTWEVDHPFPPPERASYESDPRIAATQKILDRSESLVPSIKRMHRMGAQLPQECVRITSCEFRSAIFVAQWRVLSYADWVIKEADMAPAYATHRQMLQLLQWRCPAERWVLKSPGHLWSLGALLDAYPDALLIQTHRDPLRILSSLTSLETVLRSMSSEDIDKTEIAREWSEWMALGYERSVDFRESGALPASRVIDVQFREFIAEPVAAVAKIYRQFDLELTPDFEQRMRDYVARNPSDRDGRHVHRLEDTGLDLEAERAKVKRYQDYFDVASE